MHVRSTVSPTSLVIQIFACILFGTLVACAHDSAISDSAGGQVRDSALARSLTEQAMEQIAQSKWPQAEALLQKAIEADVMFGQAHNNLGTVYVHENNLYQAAWEFQYAAKLMPYQPEPRSNMGLVLEEAGKLDEAVDSYDEALKIDPDNPQIVGNSARARVRRGDKDARVRELLGKVISADDRPDWVQWAREKLVLMGPVPTTQVDE
jgi:Flp pilus assembly protein TadD